VPLTVTGDLSNSDQSGDPFTIGANTVAVTGAYADFFTGSIDEVRYFNRALTLQEVADTFSAGSAGACTSPPATANLRVSATSSGASVAVGDIIRYNFIVTNDGPSPAANPTLTMHLPYGTTYWTHTNSQGSCTGMGPIICSLGTINSGNTALASVTVRPTVAGIIDGVGVVNSSNELDPAPGDNTASATSTATAVATSADLGVSLVGSPVSPPPTQAYTNLNYVAMVTNYGNDAADSVALTFVPPPGTTLLSSSSASLSCSAGGANLVSNASFENGLQVSAGGFLSYNPGTDLGGGWIVDSQVDLNNGYWAAADGTYSVDLNGSLTAGGIHQDLATDPGTSYTITIAMSGNPGCGWGPVFDITALFGTSSTVFSYTTTPSWTNADPGWQDRSFVATANSTLTRLTFTSTGDTCGGPLIDNIRVAPSATSCTLPSLAAGATASATFLVQPPSSGSYTATASVTSATADPYFSNNAGSATAFSSTGPLAVAVFPSSATVITAGTQRFIAIVNNSSNTAVTWSVDGIAGGNATVGTIDASGTYTAPLSLVTVTVTATSLADSSKSASATVTTTSQIQSSVVAWGYNGDGELGNGDTIDSYTPVQVTALSAVQAIGGGSYHSLAVKHDGTVWAWGYNPDGQLGDGTTTDSYVPVQVSGLSGMLAIAGGDSHSLALKSDSTVWAWGYNGDGELGNDSTTSSYTPVEVSGLSGVVAIAAGSWHNLALTSDGTVWAWGYNGDGELGDGSYYDSAMPVQVTGLSGVVAIAAGNSHSLALRNDGTVWSWGYNGDGELGNGNTIDSSTPVQVSSLSGVVSIASGSWHSLALASSGTVWAWGWNSDGQLGDGTYSDSSTPVQVSGLSGMVGIKGGESHSLALKSDGTVWGWGYNYDGELGNGTNTGSTTPVQASGVTGATAIASGQYHSLALVPPASPTGGGADLVLSAATTAGAGTYGVIVTNNGPSDATGVVLTDTLERFIYASDTTTQGTCSFSAGVVTCNLGTISRNSYATVTVTATPPTSGWASHSYAVSASQSDPNPANNSVRLGPGLTPLNRLPLANAGGDVVRAGTNPTGAVVRLDGSASSDADGDALTYRWSGPFPEGSGSVNGAQPQVTLPFGSSRVSLVVTDGKGDSAPVSIVVTVSDFDLALPQSAATVKRGEPAVFTLSVSPKFGRFDGAITLACPSLPAGTTCSFTPATITPGAQAATVTVTISTANVAALARPKRLHGGAYAAWLATLALAFGTLFAGGFGKRRMWVMLALVLLLIVAQFACGGGGAQTASAPPSTPSTTLTVTISGVSGSLTHSATATVVVR
jgi:choice-of-anchor C domain-containing protein